MKMLEQKAKAYDEKLDMARSIYADPSVKDEDKYYIEVIFPELKEKESEDENIRKVLIDLVKCNERSGYKLLNNIPTSSMLAWLERQGEQKPADKIEPKFHEGDWVVRGKTIAQILDIQEQYYVGLDIDGNDFTSSRFLSDNKIHLWTIQDAKDGDVLATKDAVFIFKHMDKIGLSLCKSYCEVIDNSELGLGFDFSINDVYPATKEQRETLFKAMADAGYTFDFEKKKLKKIEESFVKASRFKEGDIVQYTDPDGYKEIGVVRKNNSVVDSFKNLIQVCVGESTMTYHKEEELELIDMPIEEELKKFAEEWDESLYRSDAVIAGAQWYKQRMKETLEAEYERGRNDTIAEMKKPAWSKEDDNKINSIKYLLHELDNYNFNNWLDSLKCKSQYNKPEWSEEDDSNLQCCIAKVQNDIDNGRIGRNRELLTWLKSLKDRVQPKQEWSEEDEKYVKDLVYYFTGGLSLKHTEEDIVNWLRSLRPQNRWKPSDEQIDELENEHLKLVPKY